MGALLPSPLLPSPLSYAIGSALAGTRGGFSPRNLFTAGQQGVWYEPDVPTALVQRRNLLTYSDQFNSGPWTKFDVAIALAGAVTPPAGFSTVYKMTENATTADHFLRQTTTPIGTEYRVIAKAGERTVLQIRPLGLNLRQATFDLAAGTAVGGAESTASITALGDGWYDCRVVPLTPGSDIRLTLGTTSYAGDGTSGLYLAAAQLGDPGATYQRVTDWNTEYLAAAGNNVTLFQDSTGVTPVTAVEQPVGLMLDRRLGLARGPELATGFSASAGNWTQPVAGTWVCDGTQAVNFTHIVATPVLVVGNTYEVSFQVAGYGGTGSFSFWDGTTITGLLAANGTAHGIIRATNTSLRIRANGTTGLVGTLSNITVKEVTGNHATQSTAASRPVLSARVNLLTKSDQFGDALWSKSGCTAVGTLMANDGVSTGSAIQQNGITVPASAPITFTARMQAGTIRYVRLRFLNFTTSNLGEFDLQTGTIAGGSDATPAIVHVGGGVYDCSVTLPATNIDTSGAVQITMLSAFGVTTLTPSTALNLSVIQTQTEVGPVATRYQRVNTATDYDAVGFPHYLRGDGVDDAMSVQASEGVFKFLHDGTGGSLFAAYAPDAGQVTLFSNGIAGTGYSTSPVGAGLRCVGSADPVNYNIAVRVGNGSANVINEFSTPDEYKSGQPSVSGFTYKDNAAANDFVLQSGLAVPVNRQQVNAPSAANAALVFSIFGYTSWFAKGKLFGVIAVAKEMNATQRNGVARYLAGKAGLTL